MLMDQSDEADDQHGKGQREQHPESPLPRRVPHNHPLSGVRRSFCRGCNFRRASAFMKRRP